MKFKDLKSGTLIVRFPGNIPVIYSIDDVSNDGVKGRVYSISPINFVTTTMSCSKDLWDGSKNADATVRIEDTSKKRRIQIITMLFEAYVIDRN